MDKYSCYDKEVMEVMKKHDKQLEEYRESYVPDPVGIKGWLVMFFKMLVFIAFFFYLYSVTT